METNPIQSGGMNNNDETEINLGELFHVLGQHIGQIIIGALVVGIATLLITMFVIQPTYRSGFTAFVNNRNGSSTTEMQSQDVQAAQSLTYTYAEIMKSRPVVEAAVKQAGLPDTDEYSYDTLINNNITTEIDDNTQLVNLYVTLDDANDAYALAKAIADISPQFVSSIVDGTSMKIMTEPQLPTEQYSPSAKKNTAIGVVLGAFIMIIYILIRYMTDTSVKGEKDLEEKFGISVIGSIPDFMSASGESGYYGYGKKRSEKKPAESNQQKGIVGHHRIEAARDLKGGDQ